MRITVVTPDFPPAPGGLADYSVAWCSAMREHGHELTVITRPGAQPVDGVTVIDTQTAWGAAAAASLVAAIEQSAADVVVVQYVPHAFSRRGAGLPTAWMLAGVARRVRPPVVVNAHELYARWSEGVRRMPWSVTQRLALAVLVAATDDVVLTVTARRSRLLRPLRERVSVIPIGTNFEPRTAASGWRSAHGIDDETSVLVTMGLGHWTQDVASLRTLLDLLARADVPARLFVAGKLEVDHPHAVTLGFLPEDEVGELMASADLVVLPFLDGASTRRGTLMAAMAAGAPVLSTYGDDTDMAHLPSTAVRMVEAGDDEAFARAGLALLQAPEERETLKERALETFESNFSWAVLARAWTEELTSVTRS